MLPVELFPQSTHFVSVERAKPIKGFALVDNGEHVLASASSTKNVCVVSLLICVNACTSEVRSRSEAAGVCGATRPVPGDKKPLVMPTACNEKHTPLVVLEDRRGKQQPYVL